MTEKSYEEKYKEILALLHQTEHSDLIKFIKTMERMRIIISTTHPEKTGSMFICGFGGEFDDAGLPMYLEICPSFGAPGHSLYKQFVPYREPEY